jgi:hypothetical protein
MLSDSLTSSLNVPSRAFAGRIGGPATRFLTARSITSGDAGGDLLWLAEYDAAIKIGIKAAC